MLRFFTPCLQVKSVLELGPAHLQTLGVEGLLLDVDCTLKDYHETAFRPEVVEWVRGLRDGGVRICLLSNGHKTRVGALAATLEVDFVGGAFKPFPFGCRLALRKLGLPPERVAVVGDQIFADVLAGRLAGARAILVTPTSPLEPWFTRLKRPFERRLLKWLNGRTPPLPVSPPAPALQKEEG
jgi:HAD superfamily phosphatase (TIGR01668 family)